MLINRTLLSLLVSVTALQVFAEGTDSTEPPPPLVKKLTWKPPKEAGKDFVVQGYRLIYAILTKDEPCENKDRKYPYMVDLGNVTEWDLVADPNFQLGKRYYFKIQAYNPIGASAPFHQGACVEMPGTPEMDNGSEFKDSSPNSPYSRQQALLGSFDRAGLNGFGIGGTGSSTENGPENSAATVGNNDTNDNSSLETDEDLAVPAQGVVTSDDSVTEMKPLTGKGYAASKLTNKPGSSKAKGLIAMSDISPGAGVGADGEGEATEPKVMKSSMNFEFGPKTLIVILFGAALLIYQLNKFMAISKK